MMTPESEIARLDRWLARPMIGENCILRRKNGTANLDVTIRAHVRGVRASDMVSDAVQATSRVILTMTQIISSGWPTGHVLSSGAPDPRHPRAGDFIVIKGKQRQVTFVDPIVEPVVRVKMLVAG